MKPEIGTKFGRWTTLTKVLRIDSRNYIRCKCDCGTVKKVHVNDLERGKSKSCSCLQIEATKTRFNKNIKSVI